MSIVLEFDEQNPERQKVVLSSTHTNHLNKTIE